VSHRAVYLLAVSLLISLPLRGQTGAEEAQEPHLATKGLVAKPPYQPITGKQRIHWAMKSTVGPESLMAGVLSSGLSTATNEPGEYGPTWGGFGHRYGIRLTGILTSNAMEAGLGAIWGEDPRYERAPHAPFGGRVWNAIKLTFAARYSDGHIGPAYARLIAVPGNNLLSNTWRAPSETHPGDAAIRSLLGILSRMGANAFVEFWPDVRNRIKHNQDEK
jgi:hypothetical protein